MRFRYFVSMLCVSLLSFICCQVFAATQKPKWLTGDLPKASNSTFIFVRTTAESPDREMARQMCLMNVAQDQQLLNSVKVQSLTSMETNSHQVEKNGKYDLTTNRNIHTIITLGGTTPFNLRAQVVDEYCESVYKGGKHIYRVSVLYMVALTDSPVFDEVEITRYYGAQGLVRSIIPGWGQFYKGQNVRGGIIVGAQAASIAGIIVSESMKSSYYKFMKEDPKHAQEYSALADTWTNVGYGCIAAAAAVYLYNLLDAAISPGAPRVKVTSGVQWNITPIASADYAGVGLVCRF